MRTALQVYSWEDLEELERHLAGLTDPRVLAALATLVRRVRPEARSTRVSVLCPKIPFHGARKKPPNPLLRTERGSAMNATQTAAKDDLDLVKSMFQRIAADLGMIIDRSLEVDSVRAERVTKRVAGEGCVHISFRFSIVVNGESHQGCILVPLPDAITMAGYLMMLSDEEVAEYRDLQDLDASMKEAMLEVGNFVAGACDAVLRRSLPAGSSVRSEGCQGVRSDVRPALEYHEGDELVVGRALGRVHQFPEFQMIAMVPIAPGPE